MWRRRLLLGALLLLVAIPAPAIARTVSRARPRAFASCTSLVGYARRHLAATHGLPEAQVPSADTAPPAAQGAAPTAAAPADGGATSGGTTFSTTNDQEPGIDEPDIVKTDGSTIFTIAHGTVFAVAVAGGPPRLAGALDIPGATFDAQLLISGYRLIVISRASPVPIAAQAGPALPTIVTSPYYYGGKTVITEVDTRNPAAMRVTRTMTVDGTFVDARQNGPTARLVIASAPRAIAEPSLRARASGWVPTRVSRSVSTGRRARRLVAPCTAVRRPAQFSGLGMLTILTIDLDRGLAATDSDALMADAQVVYGSQRSLYVATQRWIDPRVAADQLPASQTTVIDRFDATARDRTTYAASGTVTGFLLNQFSLSEYGGNLRVATTSEPVWWAGATAPPSGQSYVTVLAERGGALVPIGQVAGLGAGQRIYSVRFVGPTAYVVTFRRVDPLYTVDLSSPTAPRVAGQLELDGYSAYLHPLGDGLLLGIGQDVSTSTNEPSGTQVELFDVSRPRAPRLVQRTSLGSGSSEVLYDHHAFLFWPPAHLVVMPLEIYPAPPPGTAAPPGAPQGSGDGAAPQQSSSQPFVGAVGLRVDRSGIAEVGRIVHDSAGGYPALIRRSLVVGTGLFTVSDAGVMESSLATLARRAFVPFPATAGGGPSPQVTSGPAR